MASGAERISVIFFLLCVVLHASYVYGGRHAPPRIEAVLAGGVLSAGKDARVEVKGHGLLRQGLQATLTMLSGVAGALCHPEALLTPPIAPSVAATPQSATFRIPADITRPLKNLKTQSSTTHGKGNVYLCLRDSHHRHKDDVWVHQGNAGRLLIYFDNHELRLRNVQRRSTNDSEAPSLADSNPHNLFPSSLTSTSPENNEANKDSISQNWALGQPGDTLNPLAPMVPSNNELKEMHSSSDTSGTSFASDKFMLGDQPSDGDHSATTGFRTTRKKVEENVPSSAILSESVRTSRTSGDNNNYNNTNKMMFSDNTGAIGNKGGEPIELDNIMNLMKESDSVDLEKISTVNPSTQPPSLLTPNTLLDKSLVQIIGMRIESHSNGIVYEDNAMVILADADATIRLYGHGLSEKIKIMFTSQKQERGTVCEHSLSKPFKISQASDSGEWAVVTFKLHAMLPDQDLWYMCAQDNASGVYKHQGSLGWLTVKSYGPDVPMWLNIVLLICLLLLSGLFSGLNLGLMALDKTELKIVSNTGSPQEQKYARAIEPVRRQGNFLLCTLLLGNVLVNSVLTVLLGNLSSGLVAVIGSTVGIVIFGEIIPQAVCSRHGLAVGARTVWLVRIFMVITGLAAWPISKLLDWALGEEIGSTYDRDRLKELIKIQVTLDNNDLKKDEHNIIVGALELYKKTVAEVMTHLDDIFMLPIETVLDFNTINEIMQQGYSRIPVYENERTNILSVLFIKDLAFIDVDDSTPLRTLCQFYQNPCNFVFEDTTLDIIFKEFKMGNKGHMAFVQRVVNEPDCDPYYEVIGLVTLEDVIEELIQEEIVDETDVFTDNRHKRRRQTVGRRDFKEFGQTANSQQRRLQISPQLTVAALQYLRTSVDLFKEGRMSEVIVKKLLMQDVINCIKPKSKEFNKNNINTYIIQQGKPMDSFILILEGHVEVTIGKESLTFESGPFTTFGMDALSQIQIMGKAQTNNTTHTTTGTNNAALNTNAKSPAIIQKQVTIPDAPTTTTATTSTTTNSFDSSTTNAATTTGGKSPQVGLYSSSSRKGSIAGFAESPSNSTMHSQRGSSIRGSVQSLDSTKFSFIPDYSVRAITDVTYLKIRRSHYIAAYRANILEQVQKDPRSEETFDAEIAKLIEDDGLVSPASWENDLMTPLPVNCKAKLSNGSIRSQGNPVSLSGDLGAALNGTVKSSSSVPGTPHSARSNSISNMHSSPSMKASNSFSNMQSLPSSVSGFQLASSCEGGRILMSPQRFAGPHGDYDNPTLTCDNNGTTNNLNASVEDNALSPEISPNMVQDISYEYKPSNLEHVQQQGGATANATHQSNTEHHKDIFS